MLRQLNYHHIVWRSILLLMSFHRVAIEEDLLSELDWLIWPACARIRVAAGVMRRQLSSGHLKPRYADVIPMNSAATDRSQKDRSCRDFRLI